MNEDSEVRVCKNKKCQKVLPSGYKYKYCEACRNKRAHTTKNVLKGVGVGAATAAGIAAAIISHGEDVD